MTKFGISQIKNHTPGWVKIVFGILIILTTAATFVVASTNQIPNDLKVEIGVWIKAFEIVIFGISKLFGIEKEQITELPQDKEK